uniref:KH domain-containing, RNA-binding, signal transduction-associated protein 2 n=1 Tax=Neogobius melanostomus TaxID=47308 RepID=A0A8C6WPS4_9GOBI
MHPEKHLPELLAEKSTLDSSFVHAARLLTEEIEKYEGEDFRKDGDIKKYLDIISNKNIKLSERVLIPVQQYPKFNFVGKLLGPRGNSMKRLQEETGVKMSILGKGSMRDKEKEEELRKSGEAKYAHLSNDLHVLIEVFAPPGEAYSRMSHALEEIKKFLVPVSSPFLLFSSFLCVHNVSSTKSILGFIIVWQTILATGAAEGAVPPERGTGRNAVAPRGSTAATHSKPPTAVVSRDVQPPRPRGAAASNTYRPPLLPATHEAYDDYGYDDGYGGEYDEESYEAYEDNYSNQSKKSVSDYYEYPHANSEDAYTSYEEEWPTSRGFRKHPYGRY